MDIQGLKKTAIAKAIGVDRHTIYVWNRKGILEEKLEALEKENKLINDFASLREMKAKQRKGRLEV